MVVEEADSPFSVAFQQLMRSEVSKGFVALLLSFFLLILVL